MRHAKRTWSSQLTEIFTIATVRISVGASILGFCVSILNIPVLAAPGDLDPTFGAGGMTVTSVVSPPYYESPSSMVVQPDGKIVVIGGIGVDDPWGEMIVVSFFLARYNPDGTTDSTFGTNGTVVRQIETAYHDEVGQSLALQPDGKIVVAGSITRISGGSAWYDLTVYRYNVDGSPDISFGGGGRVVTPNNGGKFDISTAIQADGRIIVAGNTQIDGTWVHSLVRYNPDGSLDGSFGSSGKVFDPFGIGVMARTVLLQPDGKIIIVGNALKSGGYSDFALARYNYEGSVDTSFGINGRVFDPLPNRGELVSDAILQPDGKILVAAMGYGGESKAMIRYNADGSVDPSFALDEMFGGSSNINNLFLQSDGKIFTIGSYYVISRLNSNGSVDASFGTNGGIVSPLGNRGYIRSGALQSDGKILAFGGFYPQDNPHGDTILLRYLNDSSHFVTLSGRVMTPDGRGLRNATVFLTDPQGVRRETLTSSLGYFSFDEVRTGETHLIAVRSKRYRFEARNLNISDNMGPVDFVGME